MSEQLYIKLKPWWLTQTIRKMFASTKNTTLLLSRSNNPDKPFAVVLSEELTKESRSRNSLHYFWGMDCTLEQAKNFMADFQRQIDLYETFRGKNADTCSDTVP